MKLNTLLLTSAATLMATSVAFAADLPSKKAAPSAGSVQVCKVAGKTGFTLPGSDTCVVLSGYVWAEAAIKQEADVYDNPLATSSTSGANTTYVPSYRTQLNVDALTNTEMGLLASHMSIRNTDGAFGVDTAYLQLGGLKAGKYSSTFSLMDGSPSYEAWNVTSSTSVMQVGYSLALGNGVSVGIAAEQQSSYAFAPATQSTYITDAETGPGWDFAAGTTEDNGILGWYTSAVKFGEIGSTVKSHNAMPDIVGTLDFSAGMIDLHLAAAYHDIDGEVSNNAELRVQNLYHPFMGYLGYPMAETSGTYSGSGFAYSAGAVLKLDSVAKGDTLSVEFSYADGAVSRLATYGLRGLGLYDGTPTAWNGEFTSDGLAPEGGLVTGTYENTGFTNSTGWSVGGAFHHVFSPTLSGNVFAGYTTVDRTGVDFSYKALVSVGDFIGHAGGPAADIMNEDGQKLNTNITMIGANLDFQPVKNFHIQPEIWYTSAEAEHSQYDISGEPVWTKASTSLNNTLGVIRIRRDF